MQHTRLGPFTVWFNNSEEYHLIKTEVFTHDVYYLPLQTIQPVIIDAGAHIGLTTLYFKKLWPAAHIWAVEPVPESYALLQRNCQENVLTDVTCIPAALTGQGSTTLLHHDASANHWLSTTSQAEHAWNGAQNLTAPLTVPARQLSDLIAQIGQPIDLLKLDIEGSELEVLNEAGSRLQAIDQMIIEFHPTAGQKLQQLVELLHRQNFAVELWQHGRTVPVEHCRGLVYVHAKRQSNTR